MEAAVRIHQPQRRARAGWFVTAVALGLALWLSTFALAAVGGLLGAVGVVGHAEQPMAWRRGTLDWPYPHAGLWAAVADVALTFASVGIVAIVVRPLLRGLLGRRISLLRLVAVLAFTGCVPWVRYDGPLGLEGFGAFLVTLVLVRWAVVGHDDAWVGRLGSRARRASLAACAVAAAALLVGLAYAPFHPLWLENYKPQAPTAGTLVPVELALANQGPADVRIVRISSPDQRFVLARQFAGDVWLVPRMLRQCGNCGAMRAAPRLPGQVVPAGASHFAATLYVHLPRCKEGVAPELRRLVVTYRVLGRTLTSPVPLSSPFAVRCPRG